MLRRSRRSAETLAGGRQEARDIGGRHGASPDKSGVCRWGRIRSGRWSRARSKYHRPCIGESTVVSSAGVSASDLALQQENAGPGRTTNRGLRFVNASG